MKWRHTFLIAVVWLMACVSNCHAGNKKPDLSLVWEYRTSPSLPQTIVKDQNGRPFLYVATLKGGLHILDISNPNKPKPAANVAKGRVAGLDVMNVAQKGDRLYLALGSFFDAKGNKAGLAVVSVKNPRAPKVLSF